MTSSVMSSFVGGAVAVLLWAALQRPPACAACGRRRRRFRVPSSGRQAWSGGWTCRACGQEVDRFGGPVVDP